MNKKRYAPIFGLYIFFAIILFFASDIVLSIPRNETYRLRKVDAAQYDDLSKEMVAHVETFTRSQDIMFTVEFIGYAFIPTGQESPNKAIKLVFASEENQYEVDTKVLDRFNLRDLFKDHDLIGMKHGFITRFSPLNMENGNYELYIYCYENEATIGIFETNRIFKKSHRAFKEYK